MVALPALYLLIDNQFQPPSSGLSWPQLPSLLTDGGVPAPTTEEVTPAGDLDGLMKEHTDGLVVKTTPVSIHGYTLRPTPGI